MIGHDTMAAAAKRGEIVRLFVAEPLAGAMVHLDRAASTVVVADAAV
jgi:hypothetical protein